MSQSEISSRAYAATAILVMTTAIATWLCYKRRRIDETKKRWSYTSHGMAIGAFPSQVELPDPIINAVMIFKECPLPQEIVDEIVPKMLRFERLNCIYNPKTGRGHPCENLDYHDLVRVIKINESSEDGMMKFVDQHMHDPLSEGSRGQLLPWWEFLLLENDGSGPSAVVWRMHHALADGMSMVSIVEDIITDIDGNAISNIIPVGMERKFKIHRSNLDIFFGLLKGVGAFFYMMSGPSDDKTAFCHSKMRHSRIRRAIRFESIPLPFVKALKRAAGVSLNDVIYTCISQAIHDYLLELDDPVLKEKGASLLCRTLMPIALPRRRTDDKSRVLRNRWCFLSTDFAVGIEGITERLGYIHKTMTKLKQSMVPMIVIGAQNFIAPYLPMAISRSQVFDLFARHSAVFSNVPGPETPCKFAGYEILGVQMVFSNVLPQVGILSYRGHLFCNITLDHNVVVNAERIAIHFSRAFVSLASSLEVDVPSSMHGYAVAES